MALSELNRLLTVCMYMLMLLYLFYSVAYGVLAPGVTILLSYVLAGDCKLLYHVIKSIIGKIFILDECL